VEIWALRHGQSGYNRLGLCNDDPARPVALTEEGRRQAAAAARRLARVPFDAAFTSPLPRAIETAGIVLGGRDVPLVVEPRLADIRSGFDGRPVADYLAAIAQDPLHARFNGGESLLDHAARVAGFLDWLRDRPFAAALLVGHEETLRAVKAVVESLEPGAVVGLPFANCEPYCFPIPMVSR
jgi:broad specificity phosphatase PhoE